MRGPIGCTSALAKALASEAGGPGLLRRELVRDALGVRSLPADARDLTDPARVHAGKAAAAAGRGIGGSFRA